VRLLPPIAAALWVLAGPAPAATVRLVPLRAAGVSEGAAAAAARAAEASLRDLSTLVVQPALGMGTAPKRCGAEDPACWNALAARAGGTDYGLVMVAEPGGGLTLDLVLVDLRARRMAQRRFTVPGPDAAVQPIRAAVEALVPPFLRRGYGGFLVDLPPGARLKVDGRVALSEPSRAPVPVPNGRHEVDLLLPDGTAVLSRADVAEGQTQALKLDLHPPPEPPRSSGALQITSAALWSAGALALASSLTLGAVINVRSPLLAPCVGSSRTCSTLEQAQAEQRTQAQLASTANILAWSGGGLVVAGAGVFAFDLVQGGSK